MDLAKKEGYIVLVNNLLVTVHCSFLYFGLVSTVDYFLSLSHDYSLLFRLIYLNISLCYP